MFKTKRVYEVPNPNDGMRVLVDRLWPRGLSKDKAKVDLWLRDVAPSDAVRKWFGHDPKRWPEFQRRYRVELKGQAEMLCSLRRFARTHRVITLVYAASDMRHNNAVVLAGLLNRSG